MPKKNFSKIYLLISFTAIIILLIFFNSFGWLALPKTIIFKSASLISKPFIFLGQKTSGGLKIIINLKDLAKENTLLTKENQELILKTAKVYELENENSLLRQQLEIKPPLKSKIAMADIIGFDPGNLGQYFLINKGAKDGVEINQAVIFGEGFLVGKVMKTEDNFSEVLSLTDSNSLVSALTQEGRAGGVAKGDHGVGMIMEMVPPDREISSGEIIISSGLDGHLPRGLIIGKAEAKISLPSEAFQRFKIEPAVNYKDIETVFVILGNE
ncbi:MAG: rod shape-determining protein MreC [Candidatus Portnoybacteria bacterium]|nr:rod shape-determining protein MreC [Candidatus Portnoybacteria bacterium]